MANKTASFTLNLSYIGPDGDAVSIPAKSASVSYQAQTHGTIDVPDATASATSYSVPFGGIGVDATGGIIENKTGQPLEVKINGAAAASQTIPDGGVFTWMNPGLTAGSTPILAIALKTTAMQAGAGYINFHLFGDPV